MDILLHPRLPPLVRSLPPVENVSLFRAEESEVEQELRAMLQLTAPEDPERTVSAQPLPQGSSRGPDDLAQGTEPTSPRSVPNSAPPNVNPPNPPTASSNHMQMDQVKVPPAATLSQDQEPAKDDPPLSSPVPSTTRSDERPPPASEPLQPNSWNPISFVGDEDEEEDEEIPSINMDSDSD